MDLGESLVAAVVIAAGGLATGLAAWRGAGRLVGVDLLDRSAAALTLGLGGLCLVMQALGIVGLLSRWPVTAALVAVAVVVLLRVPAPPAAPTRGGHARADVVAAVSIGAGLAGLALVLGLQGFSESTDTLQYHAPNAGSWLHAESLLELPVAVPGYATDSYPSNHTLTGVWLMLATGSDQLAYTVNVAWGALTVLGIALLTRTLGGRAAGGALVGLGVVAAPIVFFTQANSLLSDLAAAGGVAVGTAAAVRALGSGRGPQWGLVAGAALGLAAGSKYTALLPAAAAVALPVVVLRGRGIRLAAVMAGTTLLLTAFWLLRNLVEFGNPLFPLDAGPLQGWSSPLTEIETTIAKHVADGNWTIVERWLDLAREFVGIAFLLPLAAALVGLAALRRGHRRLSLAAGLTVVAFLGYVVTPTTGGGPTGIDFLIGSQLRYSLPAIVLAAGVVAAAAGRWAWVVAAPLLVFGGVKLIEGSGVRDDVDLTTPRVLVALAVAAVAAVLTVRSGAFVGLRRTPVAASALAGALLFAGTAIALYRQYDRGPTLSERLLAEHCPGGRVGVVSVTDLRSLMGRDFDVSVVAVDRPAAAGREPILDAAALDRQIARLAPALIATMPSPLQADGWSGPPGWRDVGRVGRATLMAPPPGTGCGAGSRRRG